MTTKGKWEGEREREIASSCSLGMPFLGWHAHVKGQNALPSRYSGAQFSSLVLPSARQKTIMNSDGALIAASVVNGILRADPEGVGGKERRAQYRDDAFTDSAHEARRQGGEASIRCMAARIRRKVSFAPKMEILSPPWVHFLGADVASDRSQAV